MNYFYLIFIVNKVKNQHTIWVLAKWHNVAVNADKIVKEEIISQLESTIYSLQLEVSNDIRRKPADILHKKQLPDPKLSKEEKRTIRDHTFRYNVVILQADKGDYTVVIDVSKYRKNSYELLYDGESYKKLQMMPRLPSQ